MEERKRILVVDDEPANRDLLVALLTELGHEAESAADGDQALAQLGLGFDLILLDVMMPNMDGFEVARRIRGGAECSDIPICMVSAFSGKEERLRAVEAGANDFVSKPVDKTELRVRTASLLRTKEAQDALKRHQAELEETVARRTESLQQALNEMAAAYQEIATLKDRLAQEKLYLEDEIRGWNEFEEIVGESAALKSVLAQVRSVADTDTTVLLLGETGTGKELFARAIHDLSGRRSRTLVAVNCAASPDTLLESEWFGYEKGAFTGALTRKAGRFELADKGTLFLDEIADVPLHLQAKLLRVLQEHEVERLGATRPVRVDFRVVAATNADLQSMVNEKSFRSDLFYRLNVFPIRIPPLRERPDDIPPLVECFTRRYATRLRRQVDSIASETMDALCQWHWPGNVRELQNVIERAVILSPGRTLRVPAAELTPTAPVHGTLENAEREHILKALRDTDWVVGGRNGAATRLGLKRTTLISTMKRLGIERPDDR
jgi:DNA-binding NtrC family response regulator